MTSRTNFLLGPLATPVVASLLITIFCIAAGLKVGVGVLQVIFFIILALLVWSYVFTRSYSANTFGVTTERLVWLDLS